MPSVVAFLLLDPNIDFNLLLLLLDLKKFFHESGMKRWTGLMSMAESSLSLPLGSNSGPIGGWSGRGGGGSGSELKDSDVL